jgi:hypothetical protein
MSLARSASACSTAKTSSTTPSTASKAGWIASRRLRRRSLGRPGVLPGLGLCQHVEGQPSRLHQGSPGVGSSWP